MSGGQITTCYSFKGGSGRSMSVANIAWTLAARGRRVLVVDWDLEAPGVHRYFHPFLADPLQRTSLGLIDSLWAYVNAVPDGAAKKPADWAAMSAYTQSLSLPLTGGGAIDLLGAGRQDDLYTTKVGNFDWQTFYGRLGGKPFIDHFGRWARAHYDHVLIDSRTGVSDTAGICTMQLPDVLALFFVYNRQSIEGVAAAGRAVRAAQRKIRIVPCPSRVEDKRIAAPARLYAAMCLEDVVEERTNMLTSTLRVNEVMHFPWCAYEEKLAIFEEEQDEAGSLLKAAEALSARIAGPLEVAPEIVDKDRLAAYWRRAAFRDPRLDQLDVLRSGSLSQKIPQLLLWLGETLEETAPSAQWQLALATECVSLAASAANLLSSGEADKLGNGGVMLARRAAGEKNADQGAVAEVLRLRASQFLRTARTAEASATLNEAISLLRQNLSPQTRGTLARALELQTDIQRLRGDLAGALATTEELIALLARMVKTKEPAQREAQARSYRLRATILLELGKFEAAEDEADRAFKIAKSGPETSPEPAMARLIGVKASLARNDIDASRAVERMRQWLQREAMPETMRHEFLLRLTIAEAEHWREQGQLDRATALLQSVTADEGLPVWASAEISELTARIEVLGSTDTMPGVPDRPLSTESLDQSQAIDLLRQALAIAPDMATRKQVLLDFLKEHRDEHESDGVPFESIFSTISQALREPEGGGD